MTDQAPSSQEEAPHPLVGTVIGGKYEVLEVIGSGGAGEVLLAEQKQLSRRVAVKLLRGDLSGNTRAEFQKRFLREAARAGQLSHANIVTVHDFGAEPDGTLYQVMEYIDGQPLDRIMRKGPVPVDVGLEIAEGIARGLRHAHGRGLVHRDIKPANILLTRNDEGGYRAKIVDFGLVRAEDDVGVTSAGMVMGTPAYLSPEQANAAEDVTDRSDIYSFGCLMYEMFTGKRPYSGKSSLQVVMQHMSAPYPEMSARAFEVDPRIEGVVRRCMSKAPEARPTGDELIGDLKRLRAEFGSSGAPVEPAYFERAAADLAPTEVITGGTTAPTLVSRPQTDATAEEPLPGPSRLGYALRLVAAAGVLLAGSLLLALVLGGAAFFLPQLAEEGAVDADADEAAVDTPPDGGTKTGSAPERPVEPTVELAAPTGKANPWEVGGGAAAEPQPAEPSSEPAQPIRDLNPILVRGVSFVGPQKAAALELCNTANHSKLEGLGLSPRLAAQIVEARPIASLKDVAYLPAMTPKGAAALHAAVQ